jgi:folate-binding protein YgfZ
MAATEIEIRKSPLNDLHVSLGATMSAIDGWLLPASYGDVLREYAAVRERGAGLIDLSARGRIRVSGSEAISFLNGLITNDVKTLGENEWMPAVFPNVQGRLIAAVRVVRAPDQKTDLKTSPVFILDTEPLTHERVLKTVERFTMAGDFHVTDLTGSSALISVQGRSAADLLKLVFGEVVADLPVNGVRTLRWQEQEVLLVHATHTAEEGFDLLLDSSHASSLWEAIRVQGAQPTGFEALEILRIEAGIPRFGIDMDETFVVSETNLDEAVSFTKGCYIGQEIIARIKYRGHVAKKITGVAFERAVHIGADARALASDGKEIGRLTSVTYSPQLGRTIGLGCLRYQYLAAGTQVKVVSGETEFPAEVTDVPFVQGSWCKSQ